MPQQEYICLPEDEYTDKASWAPWGSTIMAERPQTAAWTFIEDHPAGLGLGLDYDALSLDESITVHVLVKEAKSGKVVRVRVEAVPTISVMEAALDHNFIAPKE